MCTWDDGSRFSAALLPLDQKLAIIRPRSGAQKPARILGIRRSQDSNGFLLAFKFDSPTPTFWPAEFLPKDWSESAS